MSSHAAGGVQTLNHAAYVKNTVTVANQILDSIETDILYTKRALNQKEYKDRMLQSDNARLRDELTQAHLQMQQMRAYVEEQSRFMETLRSTSEEKAKECALACEAELERVVAQYKSKEELNKTDRHRMQQLEYRCAETEKQLRQSETLREQLQQQLEGLQLDKEELLRQLQESQRYSSVLELAHAEIQARCESVEEKQQDVFEHERSTLHEKLSPKRYRHHDTSMMDSLLRRPPSYERRSEGGTSRLGRRPPPPPPQH